MGELAPELARAQEINARLDAIEHQEANRRAVVQAMQRMAADANETFDLEGEHAIDPFDQRIKEAGGWTSPDAYRRQVRILARRQSQELTTPPPQEEDTDMARRKADLDQLSAKAPITWLGSSGANPVGQTPAERSASVLSSVTGSKSRGSASQPARPRYDSTAGPKANIDRARADLAKTEARLRQSGHLK